MKNQGPIKLIPRNVAALRRGIRPPETAQLVTGNPVSTRLESGVGNCFPGLEFDLRNLERRFFPFLEVNIGDNEISVVSVDFISVEAQAKSGEMAAQLDSLKRLAATVAQAGRDAASKGDAAQARKYFTSLKQCGKALDSADYSSLVQIVGQSLQKKADAELAMIGQ